MGKGIKSAIALVALVVGACHEDAKTPEAKVTLPSIDGYAGLKFGMSLNEALAVVPPSLFNPSALKDCFVNLAIRGCLLSPEHNLAAFQTQDGISYAPKLAFNRHDKLTDISLVYERESIMDPDERVSEADCLSIQDRTLDWLVAKFGPFGALGDPKQTPNAHTEKGTGYNINRSGGGFLVFVERKLANGRNIDLLSNYIKTDETTCRIEITFTDADSVERWSMSPEEQADLDRITNPSKSSADPAQEEDAPMDNDEGDEDFSSESSAEGD